MTRPKLTILLAAPRGFCAGVERAIAVVERALAKFGAPVYVRHEIVHNKRVVDDLRAKGAVFVDELTDVPPGRPVVFSAHGVPKSVPAAAEARQMIYVDATCPLVSKVHVEAERHHKAGRQIILVGHANHPEVIGTMGQVPPGSMILVETAAQAETVAPTTPDHLAYVTQTTLSVDETEAIVAVLRRRFPALVGPRKEDICYATTNRQAAVKEIAARCDSFLVVGAPTSSNANRLVEVAQRAGCPSARLIESAAEIAWEQVGGTLGLTAGASAPDVLVVEIIAAARERFEVTVEEVAVTTEHLSFSLPRILQTA
jgi:4-hydroxy-3-methylbut-2-enyl diphosphate reductase